jgi:hypothetical protein
VHYILQSLVVASDLKTGEQAVSAAILAALAGWEAGVAGFWASAVSGHL